MQLRFELTRDAAAFASHAQRFVEARIERSVLATVLAASLRGIFGEGLFALGFDRAGDLAAAALRTPPWPMVVAEVDAEDAQSLIEVWLPEDPKLPGVNGLPSDARAAATAWQRTTGGSWEVCRREALHVLDEVLDPSRPAPGHLREPFDEERELLIDWERAFAEELGIVDAARAAELVDGRLAYGGVHVWDDDRPVCVVGNSLPVAAGIRIGPVYTPPELRGRGYASSAVAARSRLAMESGLGCALFTDLANPTSNKIYAEVGYRRVADWEEIAFTVSPRVG
jgi:predicted GNAT family acetyltransferase